MSWLLDLPTQVRRLLLTRNGGTGNDLGAALYTVRRMTVRRAETVDPGMIVRSREVDKADAWDDDTYDDPVGVVLGHWLDDGRIDTHDGADQFEAVAVVTAGIASVLLHEDVIKGEYAFPTDLTTGAARGETDPDTGMIGRFLGDGSAGGYATVKLGGGGGGAGGAAFTDGQVEATFLLPTGGDEVWTRVPWDMTITGWEASGDDAGGDAEVDVWVGAYLPTVADTITASDLPTLVSDDHDTGTATGWTLGLTKGEWMVFHVNSVSGHQRLIVNVFGDRTS